MREANVVIGDAGFDAIGIEDFLAIGREAGVRNVEELACTGTGAIVQVTAESRYDEGKISSLVCVDRWERVVEALANRRRPLAQRIDRFDTEEPTERCSQIERQF